MTRYGEEIQPQAVAGWQLTRASSASALFGANGMRMGSDGKLYVGVVWQDKASAFGAVCVLIDDFVVAFWSKESFCAGGAYSSYEMVVFFTDALGADCLFSFKACDIGAV